MTAAALKLLRRGTVGQVVDGNLCVHRFAPNRVLAISPPSSRRSTASPQQLQGKIGGATRASGKVGGGPLGAPSAAKASASSKTVLEDADALAADGDPDAHDHDLSAIQRGERLANAAEFFAKPSKTLQERARLIHTVRTGIVGLDALTPIGRGASMLIVHDEGGAEQLLGGIERGCQLPPGGNIDTVMRLPDEDTNSLVDIFGMLSDAEVLAERGGKHVLCYVDMGVLDEAWREGQSLMSKTLVSAEEVVETVVSAEEVVETLSDEKEVVKTPSAEEVVDALKQAAQAGDDPTAPRLPRGDDVAIPSSISQQSDARRERPPLPNMSDTNPDAQRAEKRAFFSRITERAASMKVDHGPDGGGSVTLILTVNRSHVGLDTVRELQSLSDGHIWVLLNGPQQISIDWSRSLSRFGLGRHNLEKAMAEGSRSKLLHKIAAHLRVGMANVVMSGGSEQHSSQQEHPADRFNRVMMEQTECALRCLEPMSLEEQIALLLAASTQEMPQETLTGTGGGAFLRFLRDGPPSVETGGTHAGLCSGSSDLLAEIRVACAAEREETPKRTEEERFAALATALARQVRIFKGLYGAGMLLHD